MKPKLKPELVDLHSQMKTWRHYFHSNPETAFKEEKTASYIAEQLREFGLEVYTGFAKTGVVAKLENGDGKRVGLRAEMDALHLTEKNEFDHCSKLVGQMHGCGHDGHMAMLLGAAHYLSKTRNFSGTVYFIFQPAEENEGGGRLMTEEGLFERFPMDAVFAQHNWPGLPVGFFGVSKRAAMAACDRFDVRITGRGCHAAMPQKGNDTILAAAEVIQSLQKIVSRKVNPLDSAVVSVTRIQGGYTDNILPDCVELGGTVRSFKPDLRDRLEEEFSRIVRGVCELSGVECEISYLRGYPPTINSAPERDFALETARELVGEDRIIPELEPSMGSEDFSYMLEQTPGCYIRIGNGSDDRERVLHSPHYDFNDDILPLGATFLALLAERYLTRSDLA